MALSGVVATYDDVDSGYKREGFLLGEYRKSFYDQLAYHVFLSSTFYARAQESIIPYRDLKLV